jgi:ADP-ribose pyrophosphatase YjhB (NUDIX family)
MVKRPEAMLRLAQSINAFGQRLSAAQWAWLGRLKLDAQRPAPPDWLPFYADHLFLGWVPPQRADHLIAGLPHCAIVRDRLVWSCALQNSLHRSKDLQDFLKSQAANGRLPGWRNEFFCYWESPTCPPDVNSPPFFCVERAGFRHLGLMSHGVHIHGFLPNGDLWCARRALNKATDPGMLDNLAAGGLPTGETALATAMRELEEEAGLHITDPQQLSWAGATRLQRQAEQGWHDETLLVYNLLLSDDFTPQNKDGEVMAFMRLSPGECLSLMQAGEFTDDACLALAQALGL